MTDCGGYRAKDSGPSCSRSPWRWIRARPCSALADPTEGPLNLYAASAAHSVSLGHNGTSMLALTWTQSISFRQLSSHSGSAGVKPIEPGRPSRVQISYSHESFMDDGRPWSCAAWLFSLGVMIMRFPLTPRRVSFRI